MIPILAFRHLLVRPVRAFALLSGFAVGVATMQVLLSVAEAMLVQARDVTLLGGGELTVLPQGIEIEALRTGALTGMYFGIDRARFVERQLVGGPRHAAMVDQVSPGIDGKLLYLGSRGRTLPVRAGGEIPSRAAAAGAGLMLVSGSWTDTATDSAWSAPSPQQLYDELDRFHRPRERDSTWAEWHYFNVVTGPEEWWYITYLVEGRTLSGRLLVARRRAGGRYERFESVVPSDAIRLDTARADLTLGENIVHQRSGLYFFEGTAGGENGTLRFALTLRPAPHRYFPPLELPGDDFPSGYAVAAVRASVSGRLCVDGECTEVTDAPGYHDHNWGIWRAVTWEWGVARGDRIDLLYGGIARRTEQPVGGKVPLVLAVVDSLGVRQVLRFDTIAYQGSSPVPGFEARAPESFLLIGRREPDSLTLRVEVVDRIPTLPEARGIDLVFLQMRGRFWVEGRLGGVAVADSGFGFFETYVARYPPIP